MASVWRAEDRELGVQRAIKILSPTRGRRGEHLRARFRTEARTMASLSHPNILGVHDIGTEDGLDYIVMDLAPGGSLLDRLDELGTIPVELALRWILDVLSALAAAHAAGIVHRDIKPQNVLLSAEDRPLLADFGIAMLADRDLRTTRTGVTMGSIAYMPPEQRIDASKVSHLADIYGIGTTLYALLSGQSPVDLFLVEADSPRWEGIPGGLIPILQRACAVNPDNRYASAGQMALALQQFAAGEPDLSLELSTLSFPDPSPAVYARTTEPATAPRTRLPERLSPVPTRDSSEDAGPTLMPRAAEPTMPGADEPTLGEPHPPSGPRASVVLGLLAGLGLLTGLGALGVSSLWAPTPQPAPQQLVRPSPAPLPEPFVGPEVPEGPLAPVPEPVRPPEPVPVRAPAPAPPTERAPAPQGAAPQGLWTVKGLGVGLQLQLRGGDDALQGKATSTLKDKHTDTPIQGRFERDTHTLFLEEIDGSYTYRLTLDETLCGGSGQVEGSLRSIRLISMKREHPDCGAER